MENNILTLNIFKSLQLWIPARGCGTHDFKDSGFPNRAFRREDSQGCSSERGCHGVSYEASVRILAEAAASEGLTWAEVIVKRLTLIVSE